MYMYVYPMSIGECYLFVQLTLSLETSISPDKEQKEEEEGLLVGE